MSLRPRLFCEFPAGLAAVSLRLQGGAHCRPPISRMGNKQGYAKLILGTIGLHSGQGADGYWWAEADADVAALLRIYPDPAALLEVARIIRGWADEEPRALWERLREERRGRIAAGRDGSDPGEVAGWLVSADWAFRQGFPDSGFNPSCEHGRSAGTPTFANRAQRIAEYAMIAASNRLICVSGPDLMNTGDGGTRFGGQFATPPVKVAEGMEAVAKTVILNKWSFSERGWTHGYGGPGCEVKTGSGWTTKKRDAAIDAVATSKNIGGMARGWPPVRVSRAIPSAAEVSAAIGTPGDLEGCIVYSDPPYINTTGYGHDLPRAAVVEMAREFAGMGATVAISEQAPIEELDEWESVEISEGRVGSKRTFSAQKREFVTMNRTPGFKIATQSTLFGMSQ